MKEPLPIYYTFDFSDWEVAISLLFSKELPYNQSIFSIPDIANMYSNGQQSKNMYNTALYSSEYPESFEVQHTGSLTDMPISAPMDSHMSTLQDLTYLDTQLDPRSFLTPGDYSTSRRGSTVGSTVGSQYAWSTTSNADILSNSPNLSSFDPVSPGTSTPFMQSYCPSGSLQQIIPSLGVSGYTTQQIDEWCIDSNPTEDFYHSHSQPQPYQTMGAMSFPEIQPEPYTLNNLTPNTQWISPAIPEPFFPPQSMPTQYPYTPTPTSTENPISTTPSPAHSHSISDPDSPPQSTSASNADLTNYGIPAADGTWRCAHPGCTSQASFRRGCDLRKHFNRHRKYLFCRYEGCPQSLQSGFSSKKDRARHEAKHNPGVLCEWDGCGKVFSRVDNMKDHVRRIHRKGEAGRE
jgi:hypothetical protein